MKVVNDKVAQPGLGLGLGVQRDECKGGLMNYISLQTLTLCKTRFVSVLKI